ncbi:hypothetical protein K505DRAFT_307037 [Melanomma pulvis-pyrius CBS 109.77]|uniref:SAGA-associated factor 11 n=1 Tax=Melanomma pulvis-pyrius CBS 109.77 TaxID=1314802 RepID=A0A6A6X944_9PLEO|nr:hypothetical protein K505DRAFT_307037 [Melanomma pulvis-pyrius CBS 109.77]
MTDNSKKRKSILDAAPAAKRARFPANMSRNISSIPTNTAYPNGELNVSRFMRAHENEIKALETAMKAAKRGLSRRAFQNVPRDLRRRTGSHNPQRVPKRLRDKARKEAREDNTPISKSKSGSGTGKGGKGWLRKEGIEKSVKARERRKSKKDGGNEAPIKKAKKGGPLEEILATESLIDSAVVKKRSKKFAALAAPDTPSSRFRRRQINKTWLPTHIWHTKRATMTPGKEPLWRFAIPLRPAGKAFRLTHRAVLIRGAVGWDMSYISTIGLEGVEASVAGLLKALHFAEEDGDEIWQPRGKGKKWVDGTRVWEGWIYEREGRLPKKVAQASVIWSVREDVKNTKRKAFIRVHPSAFLHLWNEIVKVAKVQKPAVTIEDLRFEIGSIEITGPAAAETLCSILSPSCSANLPPDTPSSLWPTLASVTNLRELPANALLAFSVSDPRLRDPPRAADISSHTQLTETLAYWPIDRTQTVAAIFDRNARLAAGRSLPSQQSVNRRKTMASPSQYPDPRATDPRIPMLTFVSKRSNCWTVLLPWKCVLPVWRGIMRYPVSTGGNPRFGGLKERRQVFFERSEPSFPFDCPGTNAGWAWELQERAERKLEWIKRPKGKRIEWTSIDLGNDRKGEVGDPWACDWGRLLPKSAAGEKDTEKKSESIPSPFQQMLSQQASSLIAGHTTSIDCLASPSVFTVKIVMVQRGVPTNCARIYRLPTNNAELRSKWLSLMSSSKPAADIKPSPRKQHILKSKKALKHVRAKELAGSLLDAPQPSDNGLKAGDVGYPNVPDEEDLIGFVTTGNYNLAEGAPTAIANLVLHRVMDKEGGKRDQKDGRVCIPRPLSSMSEDRAADEQADGARAAVGLSSDALADLTRDILEDTIANVIFNTALSCHRAEKLLRMQSAATQAESLALSTLELQPAIKSANSASLPSVPTAETSAAKYENGRVFLKGNPLKTTPEIICPHCKLPRLMHPIMGKGMQNPDLTKEYCMLYPWVQRQGHDVYGNPFPTDMAKSKKERELIKAQAKNTATESVGTPGSQDTDMAGGDTQGKEIKLNTGGKPASYIPWHTCPNCKRSLLITRFAQHLEKCLGISGRQSSRNAMAKLTGQNGNGNGTGMGNTPLGSRMGTPAPGSQNDLLPKSKGKGASPVKKLNDDDDEAENDTPEKKKKKKSSYIKKADREKGSKDGGSTLKVKLKASSSSKDSERKASESSERPDGKRDREDANDPDGAPKQKKIKLSVGRSDSTGGENGASLERRESN